VAGSDQICLGIVVGVHGVQGVVRIKSYAARPEDIAAYGPLIDEAGARKFKVKVLGMARGAVLARLSGVADREAADALKGVRLYVPRKALPATNEDEFYHADLVGLPVDTKDGARLGTVAAVHNFGAGDIIEIRDEKGGELLLPFSDPVFPVVDIKGGRIVADPPAELLEDRAKAAAKSAARDDRRRRLAQRRERASGGNEPSAD
jgi:16S rRNA processing protein RimM